MITVAAFLLLLSACSDGSRANDTAPDAAGCRTDADCVFAECCHPTRCVPRGAAPDCSGVACTRHCAPGTLDCGGRCVCRDGRCDGVPAPRPAAGPLRIDPPGGAPAR